MGHPVYVFKLKATVKKEVVSQFKILAGFKFYTQHFEVIKSIIRKRNV